MRARGAPARCEGLRTVRYSQVIVRPGPQHVTNRPPPALIEALVAGERRAVARAISQIEHGGPGADALRAALAARLGRAHVVGLTGSPGAGKSTLVNALLGALLAQGLRVGVVAVDPSSPISGGALLGDRVRMGEHGEHPNVFVRSIASRGHLGGLSVTTRGIVDLLDAAGFDIVVVETVGAGQSEVEIAQLADTCIVACPPGLGDDVQAIKAGILEIAELLVVTKADLPGARGTARDLRHMTHLRRAPAGEGWHTPVLSVSAATGEGIAALVEQIAAHGRVAGRGRRLQRPGPDRPRDDASAAPSTPRRAPQGERTAALGIETVVSADGRATATLLVRDEHLDAGGRCARSVVFALGEHALQRAAGAAADGASEVRISFLRAARSGEVLVAQAQVTARSHDHVAGRVEIVGGAASAPIATLVGSFCPAPPQP